MRTMMQNLKDANFLHQQAGLAAKSKQINKFTQFHVIALY